MAIVMFVLDLVFGGVALLLAAKATRVQLAFREALYAVAAAAVVALIPFVGWLLSLVVLFYLLRYFTNAPIWPDVLLMVIVSRLLAFLVLLAVSSFVHNMAG